MIAACVWAAHRWLGFQLRDPVFLVPVLGLIGWGWHRLARRAVRAQASGMMELFRVLVLVGVSLAAVSPFLTSNINGGVDSRWYLRVLADHLEQSRAGVFPVLIGQGELQFNGAIHPYRFAPVYQNLGALLDLITGRQFGAVALQHGTVAVGAMFAALSCYFGLTDWGPRLRWTALLVSVLYVLSPAALGLLCIHDMYMSYLAAAGIPLALHCARRVTEEGTFMSAAKLAASLVLVLNSHPPVGLWTALACVGVVALALFSQRQGWRTIGLLAAIAGFTYALNAFQFQGISELAPVGGTTWVWRDVAVVVGALGAGALAGWAVFRHLGRRSVEAGNRKEGPRELGNALLVGLAVTALIFVGLRQLLPFSSPVAAATLAFTEAFVPGALLPVSDSGSALSDVQPGWALLGLGLLALGVGWVQNDLSGKFLAAVALFFAFCLLPVTPFAKAFWHSVPTAVIASTSGAVNLRLTPVWTGVLVFAGFGALRWLQAQGSGVVRGWAGRGVFPGMFLVLIGWVAWSAKDAQKLQRFSRSLLQSPEQTRNHLLPENAPLTIYSGNFIGVNDYFSHGVRDYREESRLLDVQTGQVEPGLGAAYEPPPVRETLDLKAVPDPALPGWLKLTPGMKLDAEERLRVSFDFAREDWTGILVIEGTYFYREYILPSSGGSKAFGSGPGAGREIILWSTVAHPQDLALRFRPEPSMPGGVVAQDFAKAAVSEVSSQSLPVRTLSLVPTYRAEANVRAPALLETPRTWIPGYRALRNGQPVEVAPSAQRLVTVPLEPGVNTVELTFVGSRRLQVAFFVTLLSWALLLAALVRRAGRRVPL